MPLLFTKALGQDASLGLWKIDASLNVEDVCPAKIQQKVKTFCKKRKNETAATYALLSALLGENDLIIHHDENGKPLIKGYNISISHTNGYAAILLSRSHNVAIDIEYTSNRVFKVAKVFLTEKENKNIEVSSEGNEDIKRTYLLLHWCAKETTYKYFSEQKLLFNEMEVDLNNKMAAENKGRIHEEGKFICTNNRKNKNVIIEYVQNEKYVLTYTL